MSYKNNEGYPDPTACKAIKAAGRMPTHIYNVSCALNAVAGLHGLEIMGLRDKKNRPRMATEEVRAMWVIFLCSGMAFGIVALVLTWIGSKVILSIRRQQKKFEIEDETYNKVKKAIKEKEIENEE